jgi:hypothetical protein
MSIANTEVDDSKQDSYQADTKLQSIKAGPVTLDANCLSCTGQPSHLMQLFKLACLSYNPSRVVYRKHTLTRAQLMQMRKTLIEKCEEVINTQKVFINLKEGLDLRTAKLFKDLMQFHTGEQSLDFVLTQDSILYPNTSPN